MNNVNDKLVDHYGKQWTDFDGGKRPFNETINEFNGYFSIFNFDKLPKDAEGFDAGCGNGRWALIVADKVGCLNLIEPSSAIEVAKKKLSAFKNIKYYKSTIDDMSLEDNSQDFGYCLGVLHYIPTPKQSMQICVNKLKPGAPFLVYMYYNFENRPLWFKFVWKCSDILRRFISRIPYLPRKVCTDFIALSVYFPLAKISYLLEKIGVNVNNIPLSAHRNGSFYNMRNTSLDRFGSAIEHRFSRKDIIKMMTDCGLENISFSTNPDVNWCAIGYKKQ